MFQTMHEDCYFLLVTVGTSIATIYVIFWDFFVLQEMIFRLDILSQVGFIMTVFGIILRQLARKALGRRFSYALRVISDHKIEEYGIYRHVRHPAYTGFVLIAFGVPLVFSSLYGFLVALPIIPAILYRMRIEEKMLIEEFGIEYLSYAKKTKKLLPLIY
ncbi:MAG: methyltransferase family protein [Candidatus Thorarchaeota archaeon]